MGRRSCFHCGIEDTALWRTGPPEKPNLCNPCGTRWRLKGTLANYIPKHGLIQMKRPGSQDKGENWPLRCKVPRKKRSLLPQYCLTSTGRLHRQLLEVLREQECSSAKTSSEEENDVLIDNRKWLLMSSFETAPGAICSLIINVHAG